MFYPLAEWQFQKIKSRLSVKKLYSENTCTTQKSPASIYWTRKNFDYLGYFWSSCWIQETFHLSLNIGNACIIRKSPAAFSWSRNSLDYLGNLASISWSSKRLDNSGKAWSIQKSLSAITWSSKRLEYQGNACRGALLM
jgi:hypothetical protein